MGLGTVQKVQCCQKKETSCKGGWGVRNLIHGRFPFRGGQGGGLRKMVTSFLFLATLNILKGPLHTQKVYTDSGTTCHFPPWHHIMGCMTSPMGLRKHNCIIRVLRLVFPYTKIKYLLLVTCYLSSISFVMCSCIQLENCNYAPKTAISRLNIWQCIETCRKTFVVVIPKKNQMLLS